MKPETKVVITRHRPTLLAGSAVGNTNVHMFWEEAADDNEEGL